MKCLHFVNIEYRKYSTASHSKKQIKEHLTNAKKQDGKFEHDDDKLSDSGTQINKHAVGTGGNETDGEKRALYYIFLSFLISCDGSARDKTNWSAIFRMNIYPSNGASVGRPD